MVSYQCLRCWSVAAEETGCPACGAGPDPLGIELGKAVSARATLDHREAQLRREHAAVLRQRQELDHRVTQVWAQISRASSPHARVQQCPPLTPRGPSGADVPPPASRPETSARSTQNILLILGGLLLGVAAIVFAAVAWSTFGVAGRATILAVTTLVALAIPILLRQRELHATAETIASFALLLVVLDGYAAWTVNLFQAQQVSETGYTAGVFAVTAVIAVGYRAVSRLSAPWFVGLLTAQPVLPLAAAAGEASTLGYAASFALAAAGNLAVVLVWRAPPPGVVSRGCAAALGILTAMIAAALALWQSVMAQTPLEAGLAGAVLLGVAALGAAAAARSAVPQAIVITTGLGVAALVLALSRPIAVAFSGFGLLTAAVVTALALLTTPRLPARWRAGPVAASWITAALVAAPPVVVSLSDAVRALVASAPLWHADLAERRTALAPDSYGWQPTAVLLVLSFTALTVALTAPPERLRRRLGSHAGLLGVGVMALGAARLVSLLGLPWWWVTVVDLGAGLGMVASAGWQRRGDTAWQRGGNTAEHAVEHAVARGCIGVLLLLHGFAVSLARPAATAAALGAIALGGAVVAALGQRSGARHGSGVAGASAAVAIAVLPGVTGAAAVAWGLTSAVATPAMIATAALGLLIAATLRCLGPARLVPYAVIGVAAATAVSTFAALSSSGLPLGSHAGAATVIGVGNGMLLLPDRIRAAIRIAMSAVIPATVAVIAVLPAAAAPFHTYAWLARPWQGDGIGTRGMLSPLPSWGADGSDLATLALLTVAAGLAAAGLVRARAAALSTGMSAAAPGAALTLLVTPITFNLAWPALPVVALTLAVTAGLFGAVRTGAPRSGAAASNAQPPPAKTPWHNALLRPSWFLWPVAGSVGLANCLATSVATLLGLGVTTAAALTAALWGTGAVARATGWIVAGAAGVLLAHTAGVVAELGPELTPYGVLGVAVLLLAAAAGRTARTRNAESSAAEARLVEWLSHGAAGYAALLAVPTPTTAAIVSAGYGAMLGLAALRPGRIRLLIGAASCEVLAWWIFLHSQDVGVLEFYTVPLAGAALVGGVIEMRRRPQLNSWQGYGVALAAGFLPSLALTLQDDAEPLRRLAVGAAAVATLLIGAARRRQAAVAGGGIVLALAALRELVQLWDLLPRWLPLAVAGLLLVAVGATYEQRRRDVRRLRRALGRMR